LGYRLVVGAGVVVEVETTAGDAVAGAPVVATSCHTAFAPEWPAATMV
jgi:hypothetical protein